MALGIEPASMARIKPKSTITHKLDTNIVRVENSNERHLLLIGTEYSIYSLDPKTDGRPQRIVESGTSIESFSYAAADDTLLYVSSGQVRSYSLKERRNRILPLDDERLVPFQILSLSQPQSALVSAEVQDNADPLQTTGIFRFDQNSGHTRRISEKTFASLPKLLSVTPDGKEVLVKDEDSGEIQLFSVDTGKARRFEMPRPQGIELDQAESVAYSSRGDAISVSGKCPDGVCVVLKSRVEVAYVLDGEGGNPHALAWSPDSRLLCYSRSAFPTAMLTIIPVLGSSNAVYDFVELSPESCFGWMPDSSGLAYSQQDLLNLAVFPDGFPPE